MDKEQLYKMRRKNMYRKVSCGANNELIENYMKLMSQETKAFNSGRSFSMKNVHSFNKSDTSKKVPKRISTIMELASAISSDSEMKESSFENSESKN